MDETLADDMAAWTWRRWRPWVGPALARGAAWGAALTACVVTPIALGLVSSGGGRMAAKDIGALALVALVCLAAGLVGGAPTALLEARARGRGDAARLAHAALCGAVAALGWVVVVAQVVYLVGVLRGGMERGLAELGSVLGRVGGGGRTPGLGIVAGALLGVAVPFGLAVRLRLAARRVGAQVARGCASIGCGALALIVVGAVTVVLVNGSEPDGVDRALARGGAGAVVAHALVTAIVFAVVGAPLSILTPLALALGARWAPLPPSNEDDQPAG